MYHHIYIILQNNHRKFNGGFKILHFSTLFFFFNYHVIFQKYISHVYYIFIYNRFDLFYPLTYTTRDVCVLEFLSRVLFENKM